MEGGSLSLLFEETTSIEISIAPIRYRRNLILTLQLLHLTNQGVYYYYYYYYYHHLVCDV